MMQHPSGSSTQAAEPELSGPRNAPPAVGPCTAFLRALEALSDAEERFGPGSFEADWARSGVHAARRNALEAWRRGSAA